MSDATETTHGPDDEALRRDVLDVLLSEAAFDGFTRTTLEKAARAVEVAPHTLNRLFPHGVGDALTYWSEEEDRAMAAAYTALEEKPHGITAKIRWLVKARIESLDWNREAARRAAATMALPQHGGLGARLVWKTSDTMWRTIEDRSTDFNFYTKRASLSAVYTSTLARWFADEGDAASQEPFADTWAFLDARLSNLMDFEKAKAKTLKAAPDIEGLVGLLGRLRYGQRA